MRKGDEVLMTLDEFEAIRLADEQNLYQEEAASRMDISRATFGRILNAARHKVAQALIHGRSLRITGGPVQTEGNRIFKCSSCTHEWKTGFKKDRPAHCPRCRCPKIKKS